MVRMVGVKEKTLHVNSFNALKNRLVYDVPAGYGRIEDFRPILEEEAAVIVDENQREVLLEEVMKLMENTRQKELVETNA